MTAQVFPPESELDAWVDAANFRFGAFQLMDLRFDVNFRPNKQQIQLYILHYVILRSNGCGLNQSRITASKGIESFALK